VDAQEVLAENGGEQRLLVREIDVDQVLVTPGSVGNSIDARTGNAVGRDCVLVETCFS
jgi:hypothetical protein